ncbi:MAG: hypothetical protein HYX67_03995 [Candidatus Melainabacteria bacterium]|nr:hypothetical protein [Candidatus Melainabacteria bacterium]
MMKLFVWDRSLPNNYSSNTNSGSLELGASVVVIAPSLEKAIEQVEGHIKDKDRYGPSDHYRRMVIAMKTTKPTSFTPITTPGRNTHAQVVFLSIGTHFGDTKPLHES